MQQRQIRRLIVVDDGGTVVGLLSINDLTRHPGRRADDIPLEEVAKTLSAICRRPRPSRKAA